MKAVAKQLGLCQAALIDDQKQRAEELRLAEERRKREAARRSYLNNARTTNPPSSPASASRCGCGLRPETSHATPPSTRPVCVAYRANNSRCTTEAIYGAVRCEEHQAAFTEALSALRAAEKQYGDMGASIYSIQYCSDHTLSQATRDVPYVARYLTLADTITALSVKLRRLDGFCKCGLLVAWIWSLTLPQKPDLLTRIARPTWRSMA